MLSKIWRGLLVLAITATALLAAPGLAAAQIGAGPDPFVVAVHVTAGSSANPAGQEAGELAESVDIDDWLAVDPDLLIEVGQGGISVLRIYDGEVCCGDMGDGLTDDQIGLGDTAAGLLEAEQGCQNREHCQVILVNYQLPEHPQDGLNAVVVAREILISGKLSAVAIDGDDDLLEFNRQLAYEGLTVAADNDSFVVGWEALIDWLTPGFVPGSTAVPANTWPANWDSLSLVDKILANPYGCNTRTDWIWSSDGTCHAKPPELVTPVPAGWDDLDLVDKIQLNPNGCDLIAQWLWSSDGTCHDKMAGAQAPTITMELTESTVRAGAKTAARWQHFAADPDDPAQCDEDHDWGQIEKSGFRHSVEVDLDQSPSTGWICFRASFATGQEAYGRLEMTQPES